MQQPIKGLLNVRDQFLQFGLVARLQSEEFKARLALLQSVAALVRQAAQSLFEVELGLLAAFVSQGGRLNVRPGDGGHRIVIPLQQSLVGRMLSVQNGRQYCDREQTHAA
jgi:hypothetical protein